MRRQTLAWTGLVVLAGLTSCTDPSREPVAGRYFTTTTEDGDPILRIDDPQQGPVTLAYTYAIGVARDYVVARGDSCYLYPVAATTAEAARHARVGPLNYADCEQKVRQLTGDSLKLKDLRL